MSLNLKNAALLSRVRSTPNLLAPEHRQAYTGAEAAGEELAKAIDSFYPGLDESQSDMAANEKNVVRYSTSSGERIQVKYSGDSKSGEYAHEWLGGAMLYTKFSEDAIDNYRFDPSGAKHLHIDRNDPSKSYVEVTHPQYDLLTQRSAAQKAPAVDESQISEKDGVRYAILQEGSSDEVADKGEKVLVHYTGWYPDGESFQSSLDRGQPFSFGIGHRQVIQGWDRGVEGMKVGERRLLDIPAELAYGERGKGDIPPNQPLIFEVELLATSGELTKPK